MEHTPHEPHSPAPAPRPCSTPHSAPVAWLSNDAAAGTAITPPQTPPPGTAETPSPPSLDAAIEAVLANPHALAEVISRSCPEGGRRDGWTPFARKLFLQVVAESGNVTRACAYAGLSKESAYALRNRDSLFAAGWDAACLLARDPLADDVHEKSVEGITETITRADGVVVERRRYDARLSMAVLHRLDKRCDRAAELGGHHFALVRHWDEWLNLVGKGDEQAALALLESAPGETAQHRELRQLPEREIPTEIPVPPGLDHCWKDDAGDWVTCFPPPPGFAGHERGTCDGVHCYERACTPEEAELLDANEAAAAAEQAAAAAEDRAEDEALRDSWFAALKRRPEIGAQAPAMVPGTSPDDRSAPRPG
jgi:hypothetical protein